MYFVRSSWHLGTKLLYMQCIITDALQSELNDTTLASVYIKTKVGLRYKLLCNVRILSCK